MSAKSVTLGQSCVDQAPELTAKAKFTAAECDECGAMIKRQQDEKACPKCSGYFHKGDCYRGHCDKQHRN